MHFLKSNRSWVVPRKLDAGPGLNDDRDADVLVDQFAERDGLKLKRVVLDTPPS